MSHRSASPDVPPVLEVVVVAVGSGDSCGVAHPVFRTSSVCLSNHAYYPATLISYYDFHLPSALVVRLTAVLAPVAKLVYSNTFDSHHHVLSLSASLTNPFTS